MTTQLDETEGVTGRAGDIADALTGSQARRVARRFLGAIAELDDGGDVDLFRRKLREAVALAERLAVEPPPALSSRQTAACRAGAELQH